MIIYQQFNQSFNVTLSLHLNVSGKKRQLNNSTTSISSLKIHHYILRIIKLQKIKNKSILTPEKTDLNCGGYSKQKQQEVIHQHVKRLKKTLEVVL